RLKDEYTQGMQITAASCVLVGLSGLPVNVALSYQYANFTYSEAEDQIYFEMQVGDFYCYPESCGSEETEDVKVNKLLLPGEVKVRFKWRDDYGFELKDVSFSNSALAAIGTQFGDERKLTLEELLQHAAQAYQEETQFDNALANLSHTLALLEDNNLHKQAGNDLLVKANKIALVFPADRALLGEALYQTKRLIRSAGGSLGKPQEHAHYHYEKLIQKISQQKSWGKILAGAMLAVLGVALIGLCCATGFGALVLPVLSWGLSYLVGAGVIGGLASVAGMGLFAKGVQRNRAMSEVAKDSQQLLAGVKSGYPVYQAGKQVP
ncbi:MAG TPA: hypothetical protein VHA13_00175, partial [Gammaproteobacteria bacterium]|nr:hypothetical protein [Gammaproteobacteria bacterium]